MMSTDQVEVSERHGGPRVDDDVVSQLDIESVIHGERIKPGVQQEVWHRATGVVLTRIAALQQFKERKRFKER